MELLENLLQGLAEVANQAAADAACVHLVDLDAGILEESTVDTDLTELVFNKYYLLSLVSFFDELLDESCLAGSQETAENINFCHL